MGRKTIANQIHSSLADKIAYGESKHTDKIEQEKKFGESTYKIYSFDTYDTYRKVGEEYARWLMDKGVKYGSLAHTERYVKEYIETRLDEGKSLYTLKMERSALGMIYGHSFDIPLPVRHSKDVTRTRLETANDKHISRTGKYKDIFTMVTSTGCRRCDATRLTVNCLVEKNGHYFLDIRKSKGGRDRLALVHPDKVQEIKAIIDKAKENGQQKIFEHIPKEIDVHGLRREYAQALHNTLKNNRKLRAEYLTYYPPRQEKVKSPYYKDREGNIFERDSVWIISNCLGHTRIDTSITSYLK